MPTWIFNSVSTAIGAWLTYVQGAADGAEEGGSFTVSPNAGLIVYTVIFVVLIVGVIGLIVYVAKKRGASGAPTSEEREEGANNSASTDAAP